MASMERMRKIAAWIALGCAIGWLVWWHSAQVRRLAYVSNLPGRAAEFEPNATQTGSMAVQRDLIVPQRNEESFHRIMRTEQALAEQTSWVRHVGYENAPTGTDVHADYPYSVWLTTLARVAKQSGHDSSLRAVEAAARCADPVLHGIVLVVAIGVVGFACGIEIAAMVAIGVAGLFPLAALFVAGAPDHHGAACAAAGGSAVLLLIAFTARRDGAPRRGWCWSAASGAVGGAGLWLSVGIQLPVLVGLAWGGLASVLFLGKTRKEQGTSAPDLRWRTWAVAGAAMTLVACAIDGTLWRTSEWTWQAINSLYALAWMIAGELVTALQRLNPEVRWRGWSRARLVGAVLLLVTVGIGFVWHAEANKILAREIYWVRLAPLGAEDVAGMPLAQLMRGSLNGSVLAAFAPLLLLVPAGVLLGSRQTSRPAKRAIVLGLSPVLAVLLLGLQRASEWSVLDVTLIALCVPVATAALGHARRWSGWILVGTCGAAVLAGVLHLQIGMAAWRSPVLAAAEAEELLERDLAHSLARRAAAAGSVVFAAPNTTTSLVYFGGFRGIGTFDVDNQAAVEATIRVAAASSMMEAQELLNARGVKFIVLPSWDTFFAEYARIYSERNHTDWQSGFLASLVRFDLPTWLRPVSYVMPSIKGYEDRAVWIFEVVPEQTPPIALARTVEYLIERGDLARAEEIAQGLQRYPGDINASVAVAELQAASNHAAELDAAIAAISNRLAEHADRRMPWDRRVALATVLVRGRKWEAAQEQVRQCLTQANADKIRSISMSALNNLLVVSRGLGIPFANESDRQLALSLLSPELRAHFEPNSP